MSRLEQATSVHGNQEGFDPDNITRETETLAGGRNEQNTGTSDQFPYASDVGSDAYPLPSVASNLSPAVLRNPPPATNRRAQVSPAKPIISLTRPTGSRPSRVIAAAIGPDKAVVVDASKGQFVEDLSKDATARAKTIINYARKVCRGEIEVEDAKEIIARKACLESVKDLV